MKQKRTKIMATMSSKAKAELMTCSVTDHELHKGVIWIEADTDKMNEIIRTPGVHPLSHPVKV